MNDADMVKWLKEQAEWCKSQDALAPEDWCRKIAARLEELTAPSAGSPLPPGRLVEIRARLADRDAPPGDGRMLRDLLAGFDFERKRAGLAECALADAVMEDGRYELGRLAERAAVLAAVRAKGEEYHFGNAIAGAVGRIIVEARGPAESPPHEQSLARLRRLEEALARVAVVAGSIGAAGMQQIACEALGTE